MSSSESAADLFALLWTELTDLLGTTAAATIVRRAVRRAATNGHAATAPVVERDGLEYGWRLPPEWRERQPEESVETLRGIAAELGYLLGELTGPVVVQRLDQLEPMRRNGIRFTDALRRESS